LGWQKKDTGKSTVKFNAWLDAPYEDASSRFCRRWRPVLPRSKLLPGWKQPPGGPAHGASARRAVAVL